MTLFYHYVIAFFSGGCCVLGLSAVFLILLALKTHDRPDDSPSEVCLMEWDRDDR